jgi:uncharacterized surface protein with fasciclin (FAS1) repeats
MTFIPGRGLVALVIGSVAMMGAPALAQQRNCIDTLAGMPEYERFVNAVTVASMGDTVRNMQNITIFAPNNTAVQAVAPDLIDRLFPRQAGSGGGREPDPVLATAATLAHIVQGRLPAAALASGVHVQTLAGTTLTTTAPPGGDRTVTVTAAQGVEAKIVQANVTCANGVIQGIDRVLIR